MKERKYMCFITIKNLVTKKVETYQAVLNTQVPDDVAAQIALMTKLQLKIQNELGVPVEVIRFSARELKEVESES